MPFFYSQYLKDEKVKPSGFTRSDPRASRSASSRSKTTRSSKPATSSTLRSGLSGGRLVWHSNHGATAKKAQGGFKPLKYNGDGGKKVVHFSTIEVQPFRFDWSLVDDVFYSRRELTAMGQSRFDDAATLRQQRRLDEKGGDGHSVDDGAVSRKNKTRDIAELLSTALEDEDADDAVSIRGIEHFVYPDLQQEMIRRKKEVQREVLDFVRQKRPDPQGWRLAQHSRTFSQWARNVAIEKGMKYCMNNGVELEEEQLEQYRKSHDELEGPGRSMRGSASFSSDLEASQRAQRSRSISGGNSTSFDLHEIAEDDKGGEGDDKAEDPDEDRLPTREGDGEEEKSEEGPALEKSAQSGAEGAEESEEEPDREITADLQEITVEDEKGSGDMGSESDEDERPQTQAPGVDTGED
ncbi:hypothetical protein ACHAXT_002899 [Thalassiosira profunda]